MHPHKKQAVIDLLAYIATHTSDVSSHGSSSQPKMVLGIESGFICLTGEALSKYQAVCDMLDDETLWTVKISRDYIVKGVHALLGRIIKDGNTDTIEAHLDAFMTECEHVAEEVTVYLPIDNLRLDYDHLKFGEITLTTMRNKQLEELLQRFTAAIPDQEERETFLVHWRRDALPVIANRAIAIYTITAEPTRTHELAEAEWYRFLDILRYFIFLAFQKRVNVDVGLRGDVRFGIGEAVLLPSSYRTFQSLHSVKSPQSLIVGPAIVEAMEQQGVFALADMLTPGQETAFSDTLFTGIHWVANALIQTEPANEYLSLVSCLETFLTRERGDLGSITNVVAAGVGWVWPVIMPIGSRFTKKLRSSTANEARLAMEEIKKVSRVAFPVYEILSGGLSCKWFNVVMNFGRVENRGFLSGLIKALSGLHHNQLLVLKCDAISLWHE